MQQLSEFLRSLEGGQATALGAFVGSAVGLVALLLAALYNAYLNRKRDDRVRAEERKACAAALFAELSSLEETLIGNAEKLERTRGDDFNTPDMNHHIRVFHPLIPKFGLLDTDTIQKVIVAYGAVEQHFESLIMLGGAIDTRVEHRRLIKLPSGYAANVARLNRILAEEIAKAKVALATYLH